jgi:hypothetical protein
MLESEVCARLNMNLQHKGRTSVRPTPGPDLKINTTHAQSRAPAYNL